MFSPMCSESRWPGRSCGSPCIGSRRQAWLPVRVGGAGQPPVLPGVAGLALQPVQDPDQARAAGPHCSRHRPAGTGRPSTWSSAVPRRCRSPASAACAGRGGNRRSSPTDRPGRPPADRAAGPAARGSARLDAPGRGGHRGSLPNSTSSDSGRYRSPAAVPRRVTAPCARPGVVGHHRGDHVLGRRRQIHLGGRQMGVPEDPLHIRQRHLRIPRHPVGSRMPKIMQRPVRPQHRVGPPEHRPRRVIGQRPERFPQRPPQRLVRPGRHQALQSAPDTAAARQTHPGEAGSCCSTRVPLRITVISC